MKEGEERTMIRLLASGLALALAVLTVSTLARAPEARTEPRVLEACASDKDTIDAGAVPRVVEPGECPVGGRRISDGAVASFVPPPGKTVYAEVLTTSGAQELSVRRLSDGAIKLGHVGEEPEGDEVGRLAARDPGRTIDDREGCYSGAYVDLGYKVMDPQVTGRTIEYQINLSTKPRGLSRREAGNAVQKAARNVFDTRNGCRMGDRVPVAVKYGGQTGAATQVGDLCGLDDGRSVVAFGDLRMGVPATSCTIFKGRPNYYYDEVISADIRINKADYRWTTTPGARTCSRDYDVQGVLTHEWGHVFGLGHVPEDGNRNLTMSPVINGTCQSSERSLGRGDVLGLDGKYDG
jgi:hypothetical protein